MPYEITKFRCSTCDREYSSKRAAEKHEPKCFYIPKNKACVTCKHFIAYHGETHALEDGEDVERPYVEVSCDESHDIERIEADEFLNTPASEHKQLQSQCEFWELREVIGTYKFGKAMIQED